MWFYWQSFWLPKGLQEVNLRWGKTPHPVTVVKDSSFGLVTNGLLLTQSEIGTDCLSLDKMGVSQSNTSKLWQSYWSILRIWWIWWYTNITEKTIDFISFFHPQIPYKKTVEHVYLPWQTGEKVRHLPVKPRGPVQQVVPRTKMRRWTVDKMQRPWAPGRSRREQWNQWRFVW